MAIFELVTEGKCFGQDMVNRYYYSNGTPGPLVGGAENLSNSFLVNVLAAIRAGQFNSLSVVSWDTIRVRDLYDPTEFYEETSLDLTGSHTSIAQPMPPFVAVSFKSPRYKVGRNRAYKRFAGIPEDTITGETWTDVANASAIGTALSTPITGGAPLATFTPRLLFLDKVIEEGKIFYRPYTTEASQRANWAEITIMTFDRVTTQRTRISGHGT